MYTRNCCVFYPAVTTKRTNHLSLVTREKNRIEHAMICLPQQAVQQKRRYNQQKFCLLANLLSLSKNFLFKKDSEFSERKKALISWKEKTFWEVCVTRFGKIDRIPRWFLQERTQAYIHCSTLKFCWSLNHKNPLKLGKNTLVAARSTDGKIAFHSIFICFSIHWKLMKASQVISIFWTAEQLN